MTKSEVLSRHSHYIENALRHVFLSQLFKAVWESDFTAKLHIYDSEVDDSGFDLVARLGNVTRHIQLKAMHMRGRKRKVSAYGGLATTQGGCIVWMVYDAETLEIAHYHFYGDTTGLASLPSTLTTRRDIKGKRKARANHYDVGLSLFTQRLTIDELILTLFGGTA